MSIMRQCCAGRRALRLQVQAEAPMQVCRLPLLYTHHNSAAYTWQRPHLALPAALQACWWLLEAQPWWPT